jgi:NAD-dependent deacetylase
LHCVECAWEETVADYSTLDQRFSGGEPRAPQCPRCSGLVRPRVVLFGELLPSDATRTLSRELEAGFDLVVSIGTTSAFPYIAEPVLLARRRGAATIEVNPGETEVSQLVDLRIPARALPTFEALAAELSGG